MKYFVIFLSLFVLLILQSGLVANLGLGIAGNLVLLFTVITVILGNPNESLFTVLVGGLLLDLVSGTRAGLNIISLLAVFGFTHIYITKFVPREPNRLILVICVVINTILYSLTFVLVDKLLSIVNLGTPIDWQYTLGVKLILDIIVNVVLAYPMLYIYKLSKYEFIRR